MIALWGLAFKANTGGIQAERCLRIFGARAAIVRAFDPKAMPECSHLYGDRPDLILVNSKEEAEEALVGADALMVATGWQSFKTPDFELIRREIKDALVFDGRNLYDPQVMQCYGLRDYSIGRLPVESSTSYLPLSTVPASVWLAYCYILLIEETMSVN